MKDSPCGVTGDTGMTESNVSWVAPPVGFEFSNPEGWRSFKARFEMFFQIHEGPANWPDERKIALLLYPLGDEGLAVLKTFVFDDKDNKKTYDNVIKGFDSYFFPRVNLFHKRAMFMRRVQQPGEGAEGYIRELLIIFLENKTRRMNLKVSVFCKFDHDEFIWGPLGPL